MYAERIQITNYGPIDHVDINFLFRGDETPKPVVLVGENGSGKTLLLSHIVNGLISAKNEVYPLSREVEQDRVYKLRSPQYIKVGKEYSFARVDYDKNLFVRELQTHQLKQAHPNIPTINIGETDAIQLWEMTDPGENSRHQLAFQNSEPPPDPRQQLEEVIGRHCILYFPTDRFDDPAWLNKDSLTARAEHTDKVLISGATPRRVIASSTLRTNQNWLFDVAYDSRAFEAQSSFRRTSPEQAPETIEELARIPYYRGNATDVYGAANQVLRQIIRPADVQPSDLRFGIGDRHSRVVSVMLGESQQIVPNIFQLSSGEMSLLNMFLSILRDCDLSDAPFSGPNDAQGIVVVDEIDLRLHVSHQRDVLPRLIQMFPKVQFIVTTHSPLFVLGMSGTFGEDGFDLYRMPDGHRISPEEFSEFGDAYQAFSNTRRFENDMRATLEQVTRPLVLVEGVTDVDYIRKAAVLLDRAALLERIDLVEVGGSGNLKAAWRTLEKITAGQNDRPKIVFLHDPEYKGDDEDQSVLIKRTMPKCEGHPLSKGIEHLFGRDTLDRARGAKSAFIDIYDGHSKLLRGEKEIIPEKWEVNSHEKVNLCNWLCANGTKEDFRHFAAIFDTLESALA